MTNDCKFPTILVTGGAGYIGSHTTKKLLQQGYETVVYDNLSEGFEELILTENRVIGDLTDIDLLRRTFDTYPIQAVMHFAAHCKVDESVKSPQKYYQNNVINGLNLLQVMLESGVKELIFSSSAAVYGDPEKVPISEDHPKQPKSPYGRTKSIFEQILEDYCKAYGLRCISLRYFNASGSDPECEIGELHHPETHLIPIVLDVALDKREEIEIFGTDYPTPDGTCIRDFIHVNDLADAHILALENLAQTDKHRVYNLGIGKGHSVREVIDTCREVTRREIKAVKAKRRPGDPPQLVADPTQARRELDWKPQFTDLKSIIQTAWNWHRKKRVRI